MCGAACLTDGRDIHADSRSGLCHEHQVVLISHSLDTYQVTGLLGYLDGLDALSAAVSDAIDRVAVLVVHRRTLAESVFRDHENSLLCTLLHTNRANYAILAIFFQSNRFHTACSAAHRTHASLVEAAYFTVVRSDEHFALSVGQGDAD